ncbi:hypothetical protein BHQ23_04575 [Mycobacterium gordonae]|uniref:Uncharacterized protein n=1 Tax=Mycobacterium gordonae TaxID=1778 RepID=A0A1X1X8I9_MYCGO|nr:hypothetical protein [Mycobacterium gordonae]MCV7005660.1 hypothetical protein [Mycobacterium gordonae]ODR23503.1 hypothetical protein BHQ23_04575 [Mycobacterium gordonae]ORV95226.1 hypothetical protein AWC08_15355 [Mycobacterium gordonae]
MQLRWRCAQWLLAVVQGDQLQRAALRGAMDVEGFTRQEIIDEITLLRQQFGHLRPVMLGREVTRLWIKLQERL